MPIGSTYVLTLVLALTATVLMWAVVAQAIEQKAADRRFTRRYLDEDSGYLIGSDTLSEHPAARHLNDHRPYVSRSGARRAMGAFHQLRVGRVMPSMRRGRPSRSN